MNTTKFFVILVAGAIMLTAVAEFFFQVKPVKSQLPVKDTMLVSQKDKLEPIDTLHSEIK